MNTVTSFRIAAPCGPLVFAVALISLAVGCATPWEKSALLSDNLPNIDRIQGPTQRSLLNWKKKQQDDGTYAGKSLKPIAGEKQYLAAAELFKDEKYEEARRAFKKVAKDFKKSEIKEDALFMEAEAAWQLDQYAVAHDAYAVLLKDYPSTRHMNVVSERLFKIGRLWLEFPEVAKVGEIQQVNFEVPSKSLPSSEPPKVPKPVPIFVPNFTDKQKPLFDTAGNGVAALTAVWMNDPTGPLAADAMMLVASYHARRGNYVEADRFFQMLRETFPNSRHVENAFVLGSHVKLMSYQGPEYESKTLYEAQLLKESTMKLYPNNPDIDRMKDELARIEDAKAAVLWKDVELYVRKNKPRSAAVYCHELMTQYPKSSYAKRARAKLVEFGPEYVSGAVLLTPNDPPKTDLLERILEPPVPARVKKLPKISSPMQMVKTTGRKSGTSRTHSNPKSKTAQNSSDYEESHGDEELAPNITSEAKPKRWRSLLPFGSPPQKLPEEADTNTKPMESSAAGRTRL